MGETAALLSGAGAPASLAPAAVAALGESAPRLLREDPWAVLAVPGVQPANADAFARALLGGEAGPGDPRRAAALTVWLLERAALQGHTALELTAVRAGLAEQGCPPRTRRWPRYSRRTAG
ncbi:helix-hairpin-helix domain-containing protein [Streptacidiphilus monticola]